MATQLDHEDNGVLVLDEEMEIEPDAEVESEATGDEAEPEPEETLTFCDEPEEPEEAPTWAKHLRSEHARIAKENRELRQQVASRTVEEAPIVIGEKPTLEGCDWDAERYERERDEYDDRKAQAAQQQQRRDEAQRQQKDDWAKVQRRYNDDKAKITIAGRDEAEAIALAELSPQQQAVIARHADNPAKFIIALGKNPAKLAQIASIEDPFALTKVMTKMEGKLQQKRGSRPPDPERRVVGKPIANTSTDKKLEALEKEADRTGNRDKVLAYRRQLKEKSK